MYGLQVSWSGRGHSQGQVGRDALSVGRVVRAGGLQSGSPHLKLRVRGFCV